MISFLSFIPFYLNLTNMTPLSPSPTDNLDGSEKTTIIISNLHKDDFVSDHKSMTSKMSFADQIKLSILNLPTPANVSYEEDYYLSMIEQWSNLPFLNRIIIIMKNEDLARLLHKYLTQGTFLPQHTKVSLQENLITKSKSYDSLIGGSHDSLSITNRLSNFKQFHNEPSNASEEYAEPEPQLFNAYADLSKMGIDLTDYNDDDQMQELIEDSQGSGDLKRTRSLTKTLFKPDLKVNTQTANTQTSRNSKILPSPTITLDETF